MKLPKNPAIFRCVLVNIDDPSNRMTYIGPFDRIPKGWTFIKRAPA